MARISIVTSTLRGGGAEFVARTWAGWLASNGHVVTVVGTATLETDAELLPAGVLRLDLSSAASSWAKVRALRAHLIDFEPNVALSLQLYPNLTLLAATWRRSGLLPQLRTFVSERNIVSINLKRGSISHRLQIWLAKRLYRTADGMIAISHPVGAEMVAGFHVTAERCIVVPNPATAKVSAPPRSRRPGSRDITLVLPFRLVPQKRPLLAVAVAMELQSRGFDVRILSFGTGPLLDELSSHAVANKIAFEHAGWHEKWFDACPETSIVLLPSIKEGFGNVLVEAAAAGVPSVAVSSALGVADAVVPGLTGELALSSNPVSIADAVVRANYLQMTGYSKWLERFSLDSSGRLLQEALGLVLTPSQLGSELSNGK